jgi:hypothetical protein
MATITSLTEWCAISDLILASYAIGREYHRLKADGALPGAIEVYRDLWVRIDREIGYSESQIEDNLASDEAFR